MTLDQIALRHGTDKSSRHHNYCVIYEKYFESLRDKPIVLWEAGYGGYHFADRGGHGIRMWREYFSHPGAQIITIDLHRKTNIPEGVMFIQGSQDDQATWEAADHLSTVGPPIIFIDDASHHSDLTIRTFELVWPKLHPGGIYVIEDLEASYWKVASDGQDFKGGRDNPNSTMNWFLNLAHTLNHGHSGDQDYGIDSIHFYMKMIFIRKK